MRDDLSRLILLLAGMGLTKSQMRDLLHDVRSYPPDEIVEAAFSLSRFDFAIDEPTSRPGRTAVMKHAGDSSVGERVERLLKTEARLSGQAAHRALSRMLVRYGFLREDEIPPLSKKALHLWIDRITSMGIPEKEILRLATIARNEAVHSPQPDWLLGRSER